MANIFISTTNIFLWKHWKKYRFSWLQSLLLIFIPILLAWGQIYAFYNVSAGVEIVFEPQDAQTIQQYFPSENDDLVFYAPKTDFYEELMENVRQQLEIIEERLYPFDTEEELHQYFQHHKKGRNVAIVFHQMEMIPKILNYSILTRNNNFKTEQVYLNDVYSIIAKETDEYIESGFLALQYSLNTAFMQMSPSRIETNYEIEFEKFPAIARPTQHFVGVTPTVVTLFFIYMLTLMSMVLVPMVEEKEDGVKEFLRIASSYSYLNNVTFFLINIVIGLFIFGVSLTIAWFYGFVNHIPFVWLALLITLYIISAVSYTFLMSVLFDSVFYAKTAGFLCFMAPFLIIIFNLDRLQFIVPVFNCALLYNGLAIFDFYGLKGLTFSYENLNDSSSGYYSMMQSYCLLAFDSIAYICLYFYFSHVFPGKNGTPRPFYFPFTMLFKCNNAVATTEQSHNTNPDEEADGIVPLSNDVAVKIENLTKEFRPCFGRRVCAVKGLSMDIYRNQITVLLGHNGAGKTTTMSIIAGIIPKTSGKISVDGKTNVDEYRHQIGYCPQHNVFMRYFTCMDHILFFGGLRGLSTLDAQNEGRQLLERLELRDKANEYGKNLSGGMKRRLCLGNALIGNTRIAILDEPSSGLDPESRRELWNILLEMRKDHTILLTTHYMEEAEILADKIAIISNGQGLCFDTSLKLKQKYANGYVLKLLTTDTFDVMKTLTRIRQYVPAATDIKPFVPPTLNVSLPYKYVNRFSEMLEDIEQNKTLLGISAISVTNSSLEDVFLSFGKDMEKNSIDEIDSGCAPFITPDYFDTAVMNRIKLQQIGAIFYKKAIYMRQKWFYWLLMFMFPIAAIIISFLSINANIANHVQAKPLTLNFEHISEPQILIHLDHSISKVQAFNMTLKHAIEEDNAAVRFLTDPEKTIEFELLSLEMENTTYYNEQLPAALSFYKYSNDPEIHIKILFSGNAIHSSATAFNLASNVLLKMRAGDEYGIVTRNEPLRKEKTVVTRGDLDIYLAFLPIALFFYILLYVFLPFNEERTEFKKLQILSPIVYWGSCFTFDLIVHAMFCGVIYVVHILVDTNHIFGNTEYTLFSTIYLFYGIAYIPLLYNASQVFDTLSSLYSFLSYMFVAMNIVASFMSASQDNMQSFSTWIMFLLAFPDYALRHALSALFITYTKTQNSKITSDLKKKNPDIEYLSETSSYIGTSDVLDLMRYYIYMVVVAIFFLIFIITIWENIVRREKFINFLNMYKKLFRYCCRRRHRRGQHPTTVQRNISQVSNDEKDLTDSIIRNHSQKNFAVIVTNLEKQYDEVNAVNGINFTVKKGECFGLLGMNGAGKTTTFKILTQQTAPTKGEIYYGDRSSTNESNHHRLVFGYCPQVDALNSHMTAYETLKYMGLCRGIPWNEIDKHVQKWLHQTDLETFANVCVCNYSGGTKRKLNTALAMIADPSLVFLDEPTTGVDPISRRFVWSCIQNCQNNQKNIVLTSHSMDECEYLCNRLGIMVNGQLKCIGPVQQLKQQFGLGYSIIFMLKENVSLSAIDNQMRQNFVNCHLKENYGGKLRYIIASSETDPIKCSEVFSKILKIHEIFSNEIEDFSISESSLEDIFLRIARDAGNDVIETSEV